MNQNINISRHLKHSNNNVLLTYDHYSVTSEDTTTTYGPVTECMCCVVSCAGIACVLISYCNGSFFLTTSPPPSLCGVCESSPGGLPIIGAHERRRHANVAVGECPSGMDRYSPRATGEGWIGPHQCRVRRPEIELTAAVGVRGCACGPIKQPLFCIILCEGKYVFLLRNSKYLTPFIVSFV